MKWEVKSSNGFQVGVDVSVPSFSDCGDSTTSTTFVAQSCDLRVTGGYPIAVEASPQDGSTAASLRLLSLDYTVVEFDGKPLPYQPVAN